MTCTIRHFPDRATWLEGRKDGADHCVGGSDVAPILGRSGFRGPWDVWASAQPGHTPEPEPEAGDIRQRGHIVEPHLLRWWRDASGLKVETGLMVAQHRDLPWARYSPDGLVMGPYDNVEVGGEAKTYSWKDKARWGAPLPTTAPRPLPEAEHVDYVVQARSLIRAAREGLLPEDYLYQLCWGLFVLDTAVFDIMAVRCSYQPAPWVISAGGRTTRDAWIIEQDRPTCIRVVREGAPDDAAVGWVVEQVMERRDRFLVRGEEPDPDGSAACIARMLGQSRPGERVGTPGELAAAFAYEEARLARLAAKKAEDAAKGRALAAFRGIDTLTNDDGHRHAWVTTAKNGSRKLTVRLPKNQQQAAK